LLSRGRPTGSFTVDRRILSILLKGPKSFSEVVRYACVARASVAYHLKRFCEKGLAKVTKAGQCKVYRVSDVETAKLYVEFGSQIYHPLFPRKGLMLQSIRRFVRSLEPTARTSRIIRFVYFTARSYAKILHFIELNERFKDEIEELLDSGELDSASVTDFLHWLKECRWTRREGKFRTTPYLVRIKTKKKRLWYGR
jgi:hypothetical protein